MKFILWNQNFEKKSFLLLFQNAETAPSQMSKLSGGLNLQDSQNFSNENSRKIFFHFFRKQAFLNLKCAVFTFNIYFDKSSTIPYSTVLIISDKMGSQTVWI